MTEISPDDPVSSTPLEKLIKQKILAEGTITVADYMDFCLGHEKHGYYRSQNPIGKQGDFITSPEISQIFGELLGLWCADVWRTIGSPASYNLIELGPGRGTLMSDLLRALRVRPDAYSAAEVQLVETSPILIECQKEVLKDEIEVCNWHDDIGSIPSRPTILVANEFFDALPIHQIKWVDGDWRECRITLNNKNQLCFVISDEPMTSSHWFNSDNPVQLEYQKEIVSQFAYRRNNDIFEVRTAARQLIKRLSQRFKSEGLVALIIDYGHVKSGSGATLQAVRQHKFTAPLQFPGMADLTAHVDFADLARTASHFGFRCTDPTSQNRFLLSLGLVQRLRILMRTADQSHNASLSEHLRSGAERLVDPLQMGELFKVMVVASPSLPQLQSFPSEYIKLD